MKVSSTRFKEAVNKAIKGAGFNNLIPLTSMIGIKLSNGKLNFLTTDASNNLCVIVDKVAGDDMNITVDAEKFGKLISKYATEVIVVKKKNRQAIIDGLKAQKFPAKNIHVVDSFEFVKEVLNKSTNDYVFLIENDLPDNFS